MEKILITGGTGFFGKALLTYANDNNLQYDIYVMSRNPEKIYGNEIFRNAKIIKANVVDYDSNDKFDYIIHAATDARVDVPDDVMMQTVIEGTKNMIDFAHKCNCKRMLYISSGGVYGNYNKKIVESDERKPITVYGKSKFAAENLCLNSDLDVVIARCFALSGRNLNKDIHFALGNFIKNAVYNVDIIIKSDGKSIRSYLDQDDLARALFILLQKAESKSIYNIGSDEAISLKDLAYKIKKVLNSTVDVKILNSAPDIHNKPMYVPNVDKFNNDFGCISSKTLDQSILEMSKAN